MWFSDYTEKTCSFTVPNLYNIIYYYLLCNIHGLPESKKKLGTFWYNIVDHEKLIYIFFLIKVIIIYFINYNL